ncbi:hypothetical protein [Pseudomonas aeruginosa]|uniref:hypothetical protein n=1 Tax=Pseudomonas aeruginosa TaxID=287 RepID=UPI001F3E84A0|nr:hypothetical protein [Pseudomonas aeruginosa]
MPDFYWSNAMTHDKQRRVTLKNLKVADFASQATLCFTAVVLFDGVPLADARNDGRGGMTFIDIREGQAERAKEATRFAADLPDAIIHGVSISVTLDFLVDFLAARTHEERQLRAAFRRDIANKVLFVRGDRLLYLKGVKLKSIPDKVGYFAQMRARIPEPITILAELPTEEAFQLWKGLTAPVDC